MPRGGIQWDDKKLAAALNSMPARADRALTAIVKLQAAKGERTMKSGARWTDRSSNARNGLFAKDFRIPFKQYGITLGHSVPYGIWLEVRFSGRYAIVTPTLQTLGPETMALAGTLFSRMFKGL